MVIVALSTTLVEHKKKPMSRKTNPESASSSRIQHADNSALTLEYIPEGDEFQAAKKKKVDFDHRYCEIPPDEILNNKYKIVKKLGKGAFCTTYEAVDKEGSKYAIKVYKGGNSSRDAFDDELKILIKLQSKRFESASEYVMHFIDAFGYLQYDNTEFRSSIHPCVVVNLYGDSLDKLLEVEEDGVAIDVVKVIFKQILTGLNFLHSNGIVHGDLKTDNILMTKRIEEINDYKQIKIGITDFNHSILAEDAKGQTAGTQEYCSPEVLLKLKWGKPADIWSAGCIFYELLTCNDLFTLEEDDSDGEMEDSIDDNSKNGGGDDDEGDDEESSSYDSSYDSDEGFDWDTNYSHLSGMYQLLGKPPRRFIAGGREYFNSKGHLKHNPDLKKVDLVKHLVEEFEYNKRTANELCSFLFQMIKYREEDRATAEKLLNSKFLKS